MTDYHIHTPLCKHASGSIDEYVQKAIAAGLHEIAFTDHIPLPDDFDLAHRMAPFEMEHYQNLVYKARTDYPEINIRFGIEADYYDGLETYLEDFIGRFDLDVVIMSVHFIHAWPPGNWVFHYDFPGKEKSQIYTEYMGALTAGIETGLFDVVGHIDIIKRPGESLLSATPDKVRELIKTIGRHDMAIEYNTSGFRKDIGNSYPDPSWLPLIIEQNVPITIGSDAHTPEQVALKFDEMRNILKRAGIRQTAKYQHRIKSYEPL